MEGLVVASIVLLWVVVIFNLFLTLALVRRLNTPSGSQTEEEGLKAGEPAPDFAAETLQGESVKLATYAGHPTAFVFVSPQCGPCREAMPSYEALGRKASASGSGLILVSIADRAETRTFVDEFHITLPVLVAPDGSNPFMKDYKVTGTPNYCLVDARGIVQSGGYPSLEWGGWKELARSWEANARHGITLASSEGRG
jgi:peroxiredoxin